ncbi:MAG: M48 family metallopeptidase [Clostridia bacterium]|nr:M48 family metallopeptidase [Clostridia bacterium]
MVEIIVKKVKAKSFSIRITPDGKAELRVPLRTSRRTVEDVIRRYRPKIEEMARKQQKVAAEFGALPALDEKALASYTKQTRQLLSERLDGFAAQIGVTYHRVSVKKQVSRWGSCSGKGNLKFNCLLSLLPPDVADYIMVHELCHLKQLNHSPAFWAEVARVLPQYRQSERWLKRYGHILLGQLRLSKEERNG